MVQLKLEFKVGRKRFTTEEDKVLYAASLLEGKAATWFQAYLEEYLDDDVKRKSEKTRHLFAKFDNFREELRAFSGVQNEEKEAERKLYSLQQKGSVSNYAAEFRSLATLLDWNDESLASHFYRGLRDEIKEKYINRERPEELQALIDDATLLDNRIHEFKAEQGQGRSLPTKGNKNNVSNVSKPRQPYYGPMPMDLDHAERKNKPKRFRKKGEKLSKEEKERRIKLGHCTYCDKPGHIARNCKANEKKKHQNSHAEPAKKPEESRARRSNVEVHSIAAGTRRLFQEPNYFMNGGKAEILAITEHSIHVKTRYWKEVECRRPNCEQNTQHKHATYAPYQNAQNQVKTLRLRVCEQTECVPMPGNESFHIHTDDEQAIPVDDFSVQEGLEDEVPQMLMTEPMELIPETEEEEPEDSSDDEPLDEHTERIQELFYEALMQEYEVREQVRANLRQVAGIIRYCTNRGCPTPKISEVVRDSFVWAHFPCNEPTTCAMRRIPHVHEQHFDPTTPWKGIPHAEVLRQSVAQPGLCTKTWCTNSDKNHFHDSGNERAE